MADIFVSYARADGELVRPLVTGLRAQGWSVWWDVDIPLGEPYDSAIEIALTQASCIVVIWTPRSVASDSVRAEAAEGRTRHCLVQVTMDGGSWPKTFAGIQGVDLTGWNSDVTDGRLRQLFAGIDRMLRSRDDDGYGANPMGEIIDEFMDAVVANILEARQHGPGPITIDALLAGSHRSKIVRPLLEICAWHAGTGHLRVPLPIFSDDGPVVRRALALLLGSPERVDPRIPKPIRPYTVHCYLDGRMRIQDLILAMEERGYASVAESVGTQDMPTTWRKFLRYLVASVPSSRSSMVIPFPLPEGHPSLRRVEAYLNGGAVTIAKQERWRVAPPKFSVTWIAR